MSEEKCCCTGVWPGGESKYSLVSQTYNSCNFSSKDGFRLCVCSFVYLQAANCSIQYLACWCAIRKACHTHAYRCRNCFHVLPEAHSLLLHSAWQCPTLRWTCMSHECEACCNTQKATLLKCLDLCGSADGHRPVQAITLPQHSIAVQPMRQALSGFHPRDAFHILLPVPEHSAFDLPLNILFINVRHRFLQFESLDHHLCMVAVFQHLTWFS